MSKQTIATIHFFEHHLLGFKPKYLAYHPHNGAVWAYQSLPIFDDDVGVFNPRDSIEVILSDRPERYVTTCGRQLKDVLLARVV